MESDDANDDYSYVTDETDEIDEEEEAWSVIDNQFYSQEIVEFLLDAFRNQQQSEDQMHSSSQKLYMEKLIATLSKKLVCMLKKRPIFEYHGSLDGYLGILLDKVIQNDGELKIKEVSLVDAQISTFEDVDSLANIVNRNFVETLKLSGNCFRSVLLFDHLISQLYDSKIKMLQLGVPFSATLSSLCGLLSNNPSLLDLDINHASFLGDEVGAMKEFANVLEKNQSLEKLTFFDCKMSLEVLSHLARIIKKNKYLLYLDLGSLRVPSLGFSMIFEAFKENSTIEYLFLDKFSQNLIPQNLITLFLECFHDNKSLVRHKDHRKFDDTFVNNHEIKNFFINNELNRTTRETTARHFFHASRILLLFSDLPIELKINILKIILENQFHLDARTLIKSFFSLQSIGRVDLRKLFSARNLIIQAHKEFLS